ncbi:DUF456 domain-containing protein [Natronomonas gomsonensis]|uniref:DUF456 domain-containing protein n=1 Tax=Natronomonas gomsonensis TaxID=1046043 RepID=UPI0020CA98F6|nr:DUF456 domain-containing protein [Natronomonas gomsonensis]MCY4728973.1 DUF456 domain-containing protein [Natronomonas gomsonensis]
MLPVDPLYVALALLVAAVVASFVPFVPGGALSIAGVGYYWYATGEPSLLVVALLVSVGLLTLVVDWLAGALSARYGGASLRTTAIAAVAGFLLLFVLGPLGVVVGVGGTVFAAEYYRHGDVERGLRTAAYATVGMLASSVMQALLSGVVLVGFLLAVFV